MKINKTPIFNGMRVTVMGLGLHSGGVASALFCLQHGAELCVTDLQDEKTLAPSIEKLSDYTVRYVLGRHEIQDFTQADLVIKGPSVPRNSRYLEAANCVETDISIFLRCTQNNIIGITGSKGKSSSAALIDHVLRSSGKQSWLVGNITTSPLTILDDLQKDDWLVMELSSFQLGDLAWIQQRKQQNNIPGLEGRPTLKPSISLLTNFSRDHQNYYHSMEEYRKDKAVLLAEQEDHQWAVVHSSCTSFLQHSKAQNAVFGNVELQEEPYPTRAWCSDTKIHLRIEQSAETKTEARRENSAVNQETGREITIDESLATQTPISNKHRENIAGTVLALTLLGLDKKNIFSAIATFPGLPHRLEYVRSLHDVSYYNDSAASIPEAVLAALDCFSKKIHLITGGTDKESELQILRELPARVESIILLDGSASRKLRTLFENMGHADIIRGYYDNIGDAVLRARELAEPGEIVLLSPGAASFEMFVHAYARGDAFKKAVMDLQ